MVASPTAPYNTSIQGKKIRRECEGASFLKINQTLSLPKNEKAIAQNGTFALLD